MSRENKANRDQLVAIQISDLHMSDSLDAPVIKRGAGLRGHDPVLLHKLQNFSRLIAIRHGLAKRELKWIVSGDLTRTGTGAEFDVVRDYLESSPQRDANGLLSASGLAIPPSHYVDVPGNHDHWDGWDDDTINGWLMQPPPAYNPAILPSRFQTTPWSSLDLGGPWLSSGGSIQFDLFGVDSNSGLAGTPTNRTAMGEISDKEFAVLETRLAESAEFEEESNMARVRAIICHHAFTRQPSWDATAAYPLSPESRRQLVALAVKHRVAAILTGHTHSFAFRRLNTDRVIPHGEHQPRVCFVYEIRCPTTLQAPARDKVQGFWTHHLFRDEASASVIWQPTLHLLGKEKFLPEKFPNLTMPRKVHGANGSMAPHFGKH